MTTTTSALQLLPMLKRSHSQTDPEAVKADEMLNSVLGRLLGSQEEEKTATIFLSRMESVSQALRQYLAMRENARVIINLYACLPELDEFCLSSHPLHDPRRDSDPVSYHHMVSGVVLSDRGYSMTGTSIDEQINVVGDCLTELLGQDPDDRDLTNRVWLWMNSNKGLDRFFAGFEKSGLRSYYEDNELSLAQACCPYGASTSVKQFPQASTTKREEVETAYAAGGLDAVASIAFPQTWSAVAPRLNFPLLPSDVSPPSRRPKAV